MDEILVEQLIQCQDLASFKFQNSPFFMKYVQNQRCSSSDSSSQVTIMKSRTVLDKDEEIKKSS